MPALLSNLKPIHIGLLTLFSLSLFANNRIFRVSADAHFLYLADALWSGSLSLTRSPPHKNDWASYEIVTLKGEGGKDGARLRGFFPHGKSGGFRHLDGHEEQIPKSKIKRRETKYFVSFPPLPALLMLPLFLLFGYKSPDVLFTLLFAALNGALIWSLLGRLSRHPGGERAPPERLWITLLFTLGTAHAWCAVQGRVWYTALVVGLSFHLLYLRFAIDMRRPLLAGCALAAAFATRASLICAALFFYAQLIWPTDPQLSHRERWRRALIFTLPCLCVGLLLLAYNQARFDSPFEFGHRYLAGGRLLRVQNHGLFGLIYLKKNLIAAFTLLPLLLPTAPFLKVSWHGVAIQLSSPGLIWALIPRSWSRLSTLSLLYMLPLLALLLLYQNTGWVQVSYRFIIDLLPPLLILTALNGRKINRIWRGAILWSVLFNLLAAAAFHRAWFQPLFVDLPKLFPH